MSFPCDGECAVMWNALNGKHGNEFSCMQWFTSSEEQFIRWNSFCRRLNTIRSVYIQLLLYFTIIFFLLTCFMAIFHFIFLNALVLDNCSFRRQKKYSFGRCTQLSDYKKENHPSIPTCWIDVSCPSLRRCDCIRRKLDANNRRISIDWYLNE